MLNVGRIDEAAESLQAAADDDDQNPAVLVGLAQVELARGDQAAAIANYRRAIELRPEPPVIAALGDIYASLGESAEAELLYDQAEAAIETEAGDPDSAFAHAREAAMFFASHDRQLERAVELARQDLSSRQDIYTHDAYAWTLFKAGQLGAAAESAERAIQLGTPDPKLFYHAGMIQIANGQTEIGRARLRRALELNPHFDPLAAQSAKQHLETAVE